MPIVFDKFNLDSQREYTDEGYLKVPARIARTGIQEYYAIELGRSDLDPKERLKIYRPPEEVFKDESLKSFANKPLTNTHPPELVNKTNAKKYMVGMSAHEVVKDGEEHVGTTLIFTDAEAIAAVEGGMVELSNGYTQDTDWVPGITSDGQQYDGIQRNIKGNHIAIVPRGRAGPTCRVADNLSINEPEEKLMKVTIDGVDYEVSDQAAQAIGKLQRQIKDAEEEMKEKDEEMKKKEDEDEEEKKEMKKTEDSLRAQLDDAKSKIPNAATIDKMVADRMALIESVKKVCPELVTDGKDANALMKEVVQAKCANVQFDSVSTDYIKARFDMLVDSVASNHQNPIDDAFKNHVINNDPKHDNRPAHVIAREKMIADSKNAWKFGGAK